MGAPAEPKNVALCTVAAKNYLHHARVLCRSFLARHPRARAFVLLADRNDGHIDPAAEPFELIEVETLGIPDFRAFAFKYGILEFCTAVKPTFLAWLFEQRGVEKLLYLDPDILVTGDLEGLFERLERHAILLTPHLTRPLPDPGEPSELDILRVGTYNLGFIGLRRGDAARDMLGWWRERCAEGCVLDRNTGHFVDQRWVDLVPGLFPGVHVLRDPGYNVAFWNLHERKPAWGDAPTVNGEPLGFFHFSGILLGDLDAISKHQTRFRLTTRPELQPLFAHYAHLLEASGAAECAGWPYAYGRFDDGRPIPAAARRLYRSLAPEARRRFGDPFAADAEGSLAHWLQAPADLAAERRRSRGAGRRRRRERRRGWLARLLGRPPQPVTNLMHFVHGSDPLLRRRFPELAGRDRAAFVRWYRTRSGAEPPREGLPSRSERE